MVVLKSKLNLLHRMNSPYLRRLCFYPWVECTYCEVCSSHSLLRVRGRCCNEFTLGLPLHYCKISVLKSERKIDSFSPKIRNTVQLNRMINAVINNPNNFNSFLLHRRVKHFLSWSRLTISHDKRIPLTDRDKCKARELLQRPYIKLQEAWVQEVC